jgi:hypothetical protein
LRRGRACGTAELLAARKLAQPARVEDLNFPSVCFEHVLGAKIGKGSRDRFDRESKKIRYLDPGHG